MTAIWTNDGTAWKLLAPTDFLDEATLHDLIEEAPQMLPVAGKPKATAYLKPSSTKSSLLPNPLRHE